MTADRRIEAVAAAIDNHTERAHGYVLGNPERDDLATATLAALDADWVAHLDELVEAGAEAWWDSHGAQPLWENIEPDERDTMLADQHAALSAAHEQWRKG